MSEAATGDGAYAPSDGVVAREIEGEVVIVPLKAGIGDLEDELYSLNETGRGVWRLLNGGGLLTASSRPWRPSTTRRATRSSAMCGAPRGVAAARHRPCRPDSRAGTCRRGRRLVLDGAALRELMGAALAVAPFVSALGARAWSLLCATATCSPSPRREERPASGAWSPSATPRPGGSSSIAWWPRPAGVVVRGDGAGQADGVAGPVTGGSSPSSAGGAVPPGPRSGAARRLGAVSRWAARAAVAAAGGARRALRSSVARRRDLMTARQLPPRGGAGAGVVARRDTFSPSQCEGYDARYVAGARERGTT